MIEERSSVLAVPEAASTPVGAEVLRGLTATPKTLSPWLFYDAAGSRLFDAITKLPEYYLTRTERGIFTRHADEMLACAGDGPLTVIELGAGSAAKTGVLLAAAARRQGAVEYIPVDVSASALAEAKERIELEIPGVHVVPRVADYTQGIDVPMTDERRMALYIGSSIGNFEPEDAVEVLRGLRRSLAAGDWVLLGVDMVKDPSVLLPAYDDAEGVTAAFNLNLLTRVNRELGANFDLHRFRHRVRWNEGKSRMEMHLASVAEQTVSIAALELEVEFAPGETIHTENSYKFTPAKIGRIIKQAGFHLERRWTDERGWFSVCLAVAR